MSEHYNWQVESAAKFVKDSHFREKVGKFNPDSKECADAVQKFKDSERKIQTAELFGREWIR